MSRTPQSLTKPAAVGRIVAVAADFLEDDDGGLGRGLHEPVEFDKALVVTRLAGGIGFDLRGDGVAAHSPQFGEEAAHLERGEAFMVTAHLQLLNCVGKRRRVD
jgi:hypothetical protein